MHIVLAGGGVDSTVVIAQCVKAGIKPVLLFCDYGQRSAYQERLAVSRLARHYGLRHEVVRSYFPSHDDHIMFDPDAAYVNHTIAPEVANSMGSRAWIIPYRNLFLLSVAAMVAGVKGTEEVWVGFDAANAGSTADCRQDVVDYFQQAVTLAADGTPPFTIRSPLTNVAKSTIYRRGVRLDVPFELTWSCYNNFSKRCGVCTACAARKYLSAKVGLDDPIQYLSEVELESRLTKEAYADYVRCR